MNRKERRAKNKTKDNKTNGQNSQNRGITFDRTPDGKTKVSIPVPQAVLNNIKDRDQYLKDFERAQKLVEKENLAEATQILTSLLKQNPQDYGVYELLGVASEKLKNYEAAIKFLKAAKELQPEKYTIDVSIANLLVRIDKIDEGMALAHNCLEHHSNSLLPFEKAAASATLGHAYMLKGEHKKADCYLKAAVEHAPDDIEHLYNYITQTGKPESENNPYFILLKKISAEKNNNRSDHEKAMIHYALFDCYDSIKQHEKAFDHALLGAIHKKNTLKAKDQILVDEVFHKIKEYFDKTLFENMPQKGFRSDTPVFICGMPRSGTTLLEQILQSHPNIGGVGEDALIEHLIRHYSLLPPHNHKPYPLRFTKEIKGFYTADIIGEKYVSYIQNTLPNSKRIINKAIGNIIYLGYLTIALPDAKFIHIKRNSLDSCLSTFTKQFTGSSQSYSYDLETLGRYYKNYIELMEHWNNIFSDKILNIQYEEIVENLEEKAREIIDFLELPWSNSCLDFYKSNSIVRTASVAQVRKPIYKTSINRWKKYGPKIAPLIKALGHAAPPEAREYLASLEQAE